MRSKKFSMVDLHGSSVKEAESLVNHSLMQSASEGVFRIRFVTGRGNHVNSNGTRAVLFNNFKKWVDNSPFKNRIKSCEQFDGYFELEFEPTSHTPKSTFFEDFYKKWCEENVSAIKKMAEEGNPQAQLFWAHRLENGTSGKPDFKEAARLYQLAANQGIAEAMHELARCYFHGLGVRQSDALYIEWLTKANDLGCPLSSLGLGDSYFYGYGVKSDARVAVSFYARAAAKGNEIAMRKLGSAYSSGHGITQNHERAFFWYKKAADMEDAVAEYNVSLFYLFGKGTTKDLTSSFHYAKQSAEHGDPDGQLILGRFYMGELGDKKNIDKEKALVWFKKALEAGCAQAADCIIACTKRPLNEEDLKKAALSGNVSAKIKLFFQKRKEKECSDEELSLFYKQCLNDIKNFNVRDIVLLDEFSKYFFIDLMLEKGSETLKKQAVQALIELEKHDCIFALRRLFLFSLQGWFSEIGIAKSKEKAIEYLQKAVALNDSKSMVALAVFFREEDAGAANIKNAQELFQKAADLKNPHGFFMLAEMLVEKIKNRTVTITPTLVDEIKSLLDKTIAFEKQQEKEDAFFMSSGVFDPNESVAENAEKLLEQLNRLRTVTLFSYSRP